MVLLTRKGSLTGASRRGEHRLEVHDLDQLSDRIEARFQGEELALPATQTVRAEQSGKIKQDVNTLVVQTWSLPTGY
jgi:hypothetical protein